MAQIETTAALRALYGEPHTLAVAKQLDRLDRHCRAFIGLSPFLILATQGADGLGDATPRGDHPGFVQVFDDKTLIIPDRPGNRRVDGLSNIVERPGVGILFLIPGVNETLRVNGTAVVDDDLELREAHRVDGSLPATVLVVTVKEAYLQCAKALMRSKLWADETRIERSRLPTMGEMLKDHTRSSEAPETEQAMLASYRKTLY
jgi:uncharacterized protein